MNVEAEFDEPDPEDPILDDLRLGGSRTLRRWVGRDGHDCFLIEQNGVVTKYRAIRRGDFMGSWPEARPGNQT